MRKRFGWLFLTLMMVCFCLLLSTGWGQEKVLLRFHVVKGKVYTVISTVKTMTTIQMMQGKDQQNTLENAIKMRYIIDDVDDDGAVTITATYTAIKSKQSGTQGEFVYDSDNPGGPVPPGVKALAVLIGSSITGKFDVQGRVLEIQGLESMLNKMLEAQGINENDPQAAKILTSLKKQFNDQTFKEFFQNMTAPFPDSPVGTGDTWTSTMILTQIVPLTLKNTYTVKENNNGIVALDFVSTMQSNGDAVLDLGVAQLSYNIFGTQEGTIKMETASGMVTQSYAKQHLTGRMKIVTDQEKDVPLILPLDVDSEISIEAMEKAAP